MLLNKALSNLFAEVEFEALLFEFLLDQHNTVTALSTSLVLLNETDCISDAQLDGERILDYLRLRLRRLPALYHVVVHQLDLLIEWLGRLLLLLVVAVILLGLLLLLLFLLFLFTASITLHLLFELDVNWNAAVLAEVARHRDFDDGRIVLQIEQDLVQMHVHGCGAWIEKHQVFLDLANADDCGLKHSLDVDALLRVHHLIIALLKLTVDIDVLYVELSQVLEHLIIHPGLNDLINKDG